MLTHFTLTPLKSCSHTLMFCLHKLTCVSQHSPSVISHPRNPPSSNATDALHRFKSSHNPSVATVFYSSLNFRIKTTKNGNMKNRIHSRCVKASDVWGFLLVLCGVRVRLVPAGKGTCRTIPRPVHSKPWRCCRCLEPPTSQAKPLPSSRCHVKNQSRAPSMRAPTAHAC